MNNTEITIEISETDYKAATTMAGQTLAKFAGNPGYYTNSYNSHLRGKIGEIAWAKWFADQGIDVERLYEDSALIANADLILKDEQEHRIEVKTWDERWWKDLGRCIAVSQLPKLQKKVDLVIWCVSPTNLQSGALVRLVGWSTVEDVAAAPKKYTGPKNRRQVHNYQLDQENLREMTSLLD